jgi:hypothetical protein
MSKRVPEYAYGTMFFCCGQGETPPRGPYVQYGVYNVQEAAELLGCRVRDVRFSEEGWWARYLWDEPARPAATDWIGPFVNEEETRKRLEELRRSQSSLRSQTQQPEPEPVSDKNQKRLMDFFFGDPNRDKPPGDGGGFLGIPKSLQRRR